MNGLTAGDELRARDAEGVTPEIARIVIGDVEAAGQVLWLDALQPLRRVYASASCASLWSVPREALRSDPHAWLQCVHRDDRGRVERAFRAIQLGEVRALRAEYRVRVAAGGERWVRERAALLTPRGGGPRHVVGLARDVTELKGAPRDVHERQRFEDTLFRMSAELARQSPLCAALAIERALGDLCRDLDAMRGAVWTLGGDGTAVLAHAWGAGEDAIPGRRLSPAASAWMLERLARDGVVVAPSSAMPSDVPERERILRQGIGAVLAVPLLGGGETIGWLALTRFAPGRWPRRMVKRVILVGELFANALLRQREEAEREQLWSELARAEEETQRRIARSLHDGTAQDLVAVVLELEHLERTLPGGVDEARGRLAECRSLCARSLREIRTISHFLHPPRLEPAGLAATLRLFAEGYSRRSGVIVTLDVADARERPSPHLEEVLFLAARELLANVHRHSGSATASVRLATDQDLLVLEVRDQGRGMGDAPEGVGLSSMRRRISEVGGRLELESSAGGTTARVWVPWRAPPVTVR